MTGSCNTCQTMAENIFADGACRACHLAALCVCGHGLAEHGRNGCHGLIYGCPGPTQTCDCKTYRKRAVEVKVGDYFFVSSAEVEALRAELALVRQQRADAWEAVGLYADRATAAERELHAKIERRRAAGRASREALEEENRRLRRQIAELSDRIPLGPLDNLSMMPMPPPPPTHYPPRASGSVPCIVCGAPSYIPCLPTCPIKRAVPA